MAYNRIDKAVDPGVEELKAQMRALGEKWRARYQPLRPIDKDSAWRDRQEASDADADHQSWLDSQKG